MSIKVTTRETPELHDFRARYARLIRKLPKKLHSTMFAHIIMTDCRTHDRYYAKNVMVAYSAQIAPKYKHPAATMADIKRYNPELVSLGYITRETLHFSDWDSRGKLKHKQVNRYVINTEALDALESPSQPGVSAKSEPITAPITAPTTAPYIVSKETESRVIPESRLAAASSSGRDDDAAGSPSGKNRAKASSRAKDDYPANKESSAEEEFRIDPDALETLTRSINGSLDDLGFRMQSRFTFARLAPGDRHRIPGLIVMLYEEDSFGSDELIKGLVLEGGHTPQKISDGARWLSYVLRGVGEAELRKWIGIGQEYYAVQERALETLPDTILDWLYKNGCHCLTTIAYQVGSDERYVLDALFDLLEAGKVQQLGDPIGPGGPSFMISDDEKAARKEAAKAAKEAAEKEERKALRAECNRMIEQIAELTGESFDAIADRLVGKDMYQLLSDTLPSMLREAEAANERTAA